MLYPAIKEFRNLPILNFSDPENVQKMKDAIELVKSQSGKEYPIIIGDEEIWLEQKLYSYNPCQKDQLVGTFQKANKEITEKAIQTALKTFENWRFTPAKEKAEYLFKSAEIMRQRRFELDAVMILEVGKNWIEADADLAEAIDFLEYYARLILDYQHKTDWVTPLEGEKGELLYIPLGVGAIIPPWNFPGAIMAGMSAGAIVAGNTVILKPASDSPLIAYKFVEIMKEAGLPPGVLNFVTGPGSAVGDYMVEHPKVRFISFTGSRDVGVGIYEKAGKVVPGQIWLKRTVIEMGGKDAIIVDDETDIDTAVEGVTASAYGFQGQKCSACSRCIVVESVYDEFTEKLAKRVEKIVMGDTTDPGNYLGAVINKSAFDKIMEYIEIGKTQGTLIAGGEGDDSIGYFIKPTVFKDIKPGSRLEQEEIFGPVLAVIKAKDFDEALHIANDTEYGLTGAVYTDNRDKIHKAKQLFHVGNLYINRKCTGALVGVHPFGGFNMSGTDSKTGWIDYLLLFMQAKSISEKV